jgi:hypothetical protein
MAADLDPPLIVLPRAALRTGRSAVEDAAGSLKGTVYYRRHQAREQRTTPSVAILFGGATLAINGASTDPVHRPGRQRRRRQSAASAHSVAAGGQTLVTQWGNVSERSWLWARI